MPEETGLAVDIAEKAFAGTPVLRGLAFRLAPGERAALLGPSGTGKSTLLSIIAGLDADYDGTVSRPGGRIAMVFQAPRLLPWRTLTENVALIPGAGGAERARALLTDVGLGHAVDAYPEKVSLGMQRRAALARALAVSPSLILMDEPLASLDPETAEAMRALVGAAMERTGAVTLIATHDQREALHLADRVIEIGGRPASVVRERVSPIPRGRRRDGSAVEALHAEWFAPRARSA